MSLNKHDLQRANKPAKKHISKIWNDLKDICCGGLDCSKLSYRPQADEQARGSRTFIACWTGISSVFSGHYRTSSLWLRHSAVDIKHSRRQYREAGFRKDYLGPLFDGGTVSFRTTGGVINKIGNAECWGTANLSRVFSKRAALTTCLTQFISAITLLFDRKRCFIFPSKFLLLIEVARQQHSFKLEGPAATTLQKHGSWLCDQRTIAWDKRTAALSATIKRLERHWTCAWDCTFSLGGTTPRFAFWRGTANTHTRQYKFLYAWSKLS